MQLSYVYILLCSDSTYYVGVTSNLEKRLEEHIEGKHFGSYTYNRRPVKLVYYTSFTDIEIAIDYEKKIKKWSQQKKLALIEGRYDDLPNLSKKKF
jgi:putative endonuclease